ncbi:hypothetical protein SteCoe_17197 [Stentor coeruleus]|uniref:Uncharacterized protein n=1 Tax=Stentor coeruleus TaxID=5963 RepID=A0A1R2BZH2_9CILI|nr:hypothetical protein SteCoe_17197 [Stentor coeruleus]
MQNYESYYPNPRPSDILILKPPPKVSIDFFIESRRHYSSLSTLSHKTHIASRSFSNISDDITLNLTLKYKKPDPNTGLKNFFKTSTEKYKISRGGNLPGVHRHKVYNLKDKNQDKNMLVPYMKRNKLYADFTSLNKITAENLELEKQIKVISKNLRKNNTNPNMSTCDSMDKSIMTTDFKIHKVVKRIKKIEKNEVKPVKKCEKIQSGIVSVAYPYCSCCKTDWQKMNEQIMNI